MVLRWAVMTGVIASAVACRGSERQSGASPAASATAAAASSAPAKQEAPPSPSRPSSAEQRPTTLLYVRIPAAIQPLERGEKFEEPLDMLLRERHLGEVSGGGSALKAGGGIEYVGIDVDVYDSKAALPVIVQKLRELKVPKGTTIEETRDETHDDEPAVSHSVW